MNEEKRPDLTDLTPEPLIAPYVPQENDAPAKPDGEFARDTAAWD